MSDKEIGYLILREKEERQRADNTSDASVASLHIRFAEEYRRRLSILEGGLPLAVPLWRIRPVD